MVSFEERLKELMLQQNISQKELAHLSGISESSISRYLSGSLKPRMDILINISKVFGVTTSYLTGENEENIQLDPYEEIKYVVARNKNLLSDEEKMDLIKILFGEK